MKFNKKKTESRNWNVKIETTSNPKHIKKTHTHARTDSQASIHIQFKTELK